MSESKDLVEQKENSLGLIRESSKIFYESGIFEDVKNEAQALVKILAGREVGLSPLESMMNFYIVKNRVAATSKVIAALIKKSAKYDYFIEKLDDTECIISFLKNENEIGKSTFTFKDAAKAGLVNKDNWKNYPRNMLFARALSNGSRWYCPDAFCGYCTEELEDLGPVEVNPALITLDEEGVKTNGK